MQRKDKKNKERAFQIINKYNQNNNILFLYIVQGRDVKYIEKYFLSPFLCLCLSFLILLLVVIVCVGCCVVRCGGNFDT